MALAMSGAIMGVASVLGLITGLETTLWLAVGIIAALIIAHSVRRRRFLHGFWSGMVGGGIAPLILVALWTSYLNNHPDLAVELLQAPPEFNPRIFMLAATPLIAAFSGVIEGGLAWAAGKLLGKKQAAPA